MFRVNIFKKSKHFAPSDEEGERTARTNKTGGGKTEHQATPVDSVKSAKNRKDSPVVCKRKRNNGKDHLVRSKSGTVQTMHWLLLVMSIRPPLCSWKWKQLVSGCCVIVIQKLEIVWQCEKCFTKRYENQATTIRADDYISDKDEPA